jgi:glycerol kinase
MPNNILAIDQGTTGTTCFVVQLQPNTIILGRGYSELPQHFPKPGWVEHDLEEIWKSVGIAAQQALAQAGTQDIAGIGITNQRETTCLWDTTAQPVCNAVVWQDRRTAEQCHTLKPHEELFKSRTGLVLDPYFSGTKLAWLLNNANLRSRAQSGDLRFGTVDSWLVYKLTAGEKHVTDATNASRTLMFDIHDNQWSDDLCDALGGIPRKLLPEVHACNEIYGQTRGTGFLPDGIPISGMAGDQHAALFGQACFEEGMAKCTYGTGAFVLMNVGKKPIQSHQGLLSTLAWRLNKQNTYALEGSVFVAGAAVQWLRDGLQLFKTSAEIEGLAAEVPDSGGVIFVPALTGLGAPHWRPEARGMLSGLTRGTTKAHIARATLEGIALQVHDLLHAMAQDKGSAVSDLRVDGGAAANNLLVQLQADLLQKSIVRPKIVETTAMGAAYLAALGIGMFSDLKEIQSAWEKDRTFTPQANVDLQPLLKLWHRTLAKI